MHFRGDSASRRIAIDNRMRHFVVETTENKKNNVLFLALEDNYNGSVDGCDYYRPCRRVCGALVSAAHCAHARKREH